MNDNTTTGCAEYQSLSRRDLLAGAGALAATWLPQITYSQDVQAFATSTPRDIVVTIFLRGGADAFALCAPYGDSLYGTYRNKTKADPPSGTDPLRRCIDLNGFFGLPPAMAPLYPYYQNKTLLIAHQTGTTTAEATRSHFEAQHFLEAGKEDMFLSTGWMGRHLASVTEMKTGAQLRAFALAGQMPLLLSGGPKTGLITDLTNFGIGGDPANVTKRLDFLTAAYATADPKLKDAATTTRKTLEVLQTVNYANYKPGGGAVYNPPYVSTLANASTVTTQIPPSVTAFGEAMKATAAVLKSGVGVESVHLDFTGWDSHQFEAIFEGRDTAGKPVLSGIFWYLWSLASNLSAFYKDLDSVPAGTGQTLMNKVTIVVMTEFGRTVDENGNQGTDHGQGAAMMFMGKNVNGGRVDNQWKTLATGGIDNMGGLAVTLDYRLFLGELVEKRLQNLAQLGAIFPGYKKPTSGWRGAFK